MNDFKKIKGATIASVEVKTGGYGLPAEVILTTTTGEVFRIDNRGEDGGECGHYPGLNLSRTPAR